MYLLAAKFPIMNCLTFLLLLSSQLLITSLVVGQENREITVTPELKKFIVKIHNDYRRMEGSSNMQEMVWDDGLSRIAANWAGGCLFEHQIIGYGENLAFMTNRGNFKTQIETVMKSMYEDEKRLYTYSDRNQCGSACHYTQIVWAETNKVGCAMHFCNPLRTRGTRYQNAWYFTCFYDPRANFCRPPCYPFLRGRACSECNDSRPVCKNKLCAGRSGGNGSINPSIRNPRSANQTNECFDNDVTCPDRAKDGK